MLTDLTEPAAQDSRPLPQLPQPWPRGACGREEGRCTRRTVTERLGKKEGRDPILGDAFLQARLAPCRAAAIFQSLDWQLVAVSVPFPPRPNLKDEFNIYLLAPELREAAGGRAATARGTSTPTPRHGAVPLMNECGGRAEVPSPEQPLHAGKAALRSRYNGIRLNSSLHSRS